MSYYQILNELKEAEGKLHQAGLILYNIIKPPSWDDEKEMWKKKNAS